MAASSRSICYFLYLTTLVIAGILVSGNKITTQEECQGDVQGLQTQCMKFVQKSGPVSDPTTSCCDVVKKTDVACMCGKIPPSLEEKMSSEKLQHVAQYCGNPIPPGVKCGMNKFIGLLKGSRAKIVCIHWIA
ncbi:hypothetical protein NE237_020580 [Protea cynaroides]|uniref:Bifunctional inhibitor/plant lipid transfer protein/seed storage helical domain-containing protein n=1 Tax=Protea cynaroides TaxID=273540 RepID=A0A9Q0H9P0_9MAGN|nr:hypothetical protein NE237_020580 [Protea cynaroides]